MYPTDRELIDGYTKNAWRAFYGLLGSLAVNSAMLFVYVFPVVGFWTGHVALAGIAFACSAASRVVIGKVTRAKVWPEALLHPLAILAFAWINLLSWIRHVRGTNTWKGRAV